MFKKILVPLDGSSLAEQALSAATAVAHAAHAAIDLVLVHRAYPFELAASTTRSELWNAERDYLDGVAADLASRGVASVTHEMLRGDPVEMICRRINDVNADLVIMTTHALTGLSRAWMGSVADGIVRFSTAPVLALRPLDESIRRNAAQPLFKNILIPVDGSAGATEIFDAATAVASCGQACLSLLRVIEPIPLLSTEPGLPTAYLATFVNEPSTHRQAKEATAELTEVARRLEKTSGLTTTAHVIVEAHVGRAITDFARAHWNDLVAMTTHGRGVSRLLLGSIADKVMRGGSLPLLLYRPQKEQTGFDAAPANLHVVAGLTL